MTVVSPMASLSSERLGQIVEDSSCETYIFSLDSYKFVLVNRVARENLGYSMEELRELSPWDLKPGISRDQFLTMVTPLIGNERSPLSFETSHRRKDGTLYPVSVRLQLMDGDQPVFYATTQNTTAHKRTEDELKHVATQLDGILNNTTMSVFMMDGSQQCVFMNQAAERMTGYTLAETQGRQLHDVIHHTYRDGRPFPQDECIIDRAFLDDHQVRGEEWLVRKNGTFVPVGFTVSPLRSDAGEPAGHIIEVRDITEELHAREALTEFNEQLRLRVHEAIEDRKKIEIQLLQAQKMEAIGQLTGGIAHDFNNLLQVVGGSLQLLEQDIGTSERARNRLEAARDGVSRGAKLAAQLLAFGRQQPLQPKPRNVGKLLWGLNDMLARVLGEAIEIETVVGGGLWNCLVDSAQVENAIVNLAINARDAMGEQGKLTIEAGNAVLDDLYAAEHADVQAGRYVTLTVSDTGHGMSPQVLERALEPFFTTKQPGAGTGLGLSMVYGFVKQSGGHLDIDSEEGRGTTVRIYLPRTGEEEPAAASPARQVNKGGSETVLVVEDDAMVRSVAIDLLTSLGYKTLEASNAENGLAVIDSGIPVDLLFTDIVMPGNLRSSKLARIAKQRLPKLAVLFTSGFTENANAQPGRLDGDVDLLSKPYSRQQLSDKIRSVLDKRLPAPEGRDAAATDDPPLSAILNGMNLLVVEDEVIIRMTIVHMLEDLGVDVIEAGTLKEARLAVRKHHPQIVLTDLNLPDGSSLDLIMELRRDSPQTRIIVSSGFDVPSVLGDKLPHDEVQVLAKPYDRYAVEASLRAAMQQGKPAPQRSEAETTH